MAEYVLQVATHEDARFLVEVIAQASHLEFADVEARRLFIDSTLVRIHEDIDRGTTSVISVGGTPVGRLRVERTGALIELSGIQLLPRFQGRGIGTAIIRDLQSEASGACVPLDLGVRKQNLSALRLYERLGFVQVGESDDERLMRWLSAAR